ncbi:MAG: 2-amino-4-hydroxy-6-hydroxymethyldihydropteridine diphosphokinase, partial [Nitrospinota bacterium]
GYEEQDWFLNAVLRVQTTLSPRSLLQRVKQIEQRMKRVPTVRWGPRVIDIDLLLYDTLIVQEADLQIPHPELRHRAFVLIPLCELAPHLTLPGGESLSLLHHHLPVQEVYYYAPFPLPCAE